MGSMVKHALLVFAAIVVTATSATAQDFGTDWIDRVTAELAQERGPLQAHPWELHLTGGVEYYFDDNIFLIEDDEIDDSIIIPFVRATVTYSEQRFEFTGDLLANYKFYVDENDGDSDLSDDEERLYLRARQAASRYSLEIAEILQRVSDPIGVVFVDRAERFVSNTVPRVEFDLNRQWAVEADANYQVVRYDDSDLGRAIENNSARVQGAIVYRTAHGYDLLAQVGWQDISYTAQQTEGAPPDAFGWYGRLGIRGELMQRLFVEAYVGFDHIESDFFAGTSEDQEDNTSSGFVNLRYELTETVKLTAEYARQFTFAGGGDPYQRVDRVLFIADLDVNPQVGFKLRAQYDHASTALSDERTYFSAGASAWWKPIAWLITDAGVTLRTGEFEDQAGFVDSEYDNLIFHVGLAASY
jgi:hypothetical protein